MSNSTIEIVDCEVGILKRYITNVSIIKGQHLNSLYGQIDTIPGWLTPPQFCLLYAIGLATIGKIVEIGAHKGKSVAVWCSSTVANLTSIYCVDLFEWGNEYFLGEFKSNLNRFNILNRVQIQQGDSSKIVYTHDNNSINLLYIDGDHTYNGVVADINNWYPKLKSGGLIVGHDYPNPNDPNGGFEGVRDAVNQYVRDCPDKFSYFGFFCGLWAALKN